MDDARLDRVIEAAIREPGFSGVISIRRGPDVLHESAHGHANRTYRAPNAIDTRFGIASGTKFLTALAIGRLLDRGDLSISTRLVECLPLERPRYDPTITVAQLLSHTSGVPDYFDEELAPDPESFGVGVPWSELRNLRDYVAVLPDTGMKFPPGAAFSYSNSGYILLGLVVEEISGHPYRDFVASEVLRPAGMDSSGFHAFDRLPENTATGYIDEEDGTWRTNEFQLPIIGAADGGAFSTVGDVARMWHAFSRGSIVSRELVEDFTHPHARAEKEGEHVHYGRGLWVTTTPGQAPILAIEGYDAGVSFRSSFRPEDGSLVTVVSNTTRGAWPVLRALREAGVPA
ncbi:MAG: beta-lactamase family protein [Gemmatimonadetes bacterium]|nr:beta-lactamase family protein [Gemmatimonadota bacterium]